MSILFCGTTDLDFQIPLPSGVAASTSGARGGSWASEAIQVGSTSAARTRSILFPGGAVTTAWLTFRVTPGSGLTTARMLCGLAQSGNDKGVFVGTVAGSNGAKLAIHKWDGSSIVQLVAESGASLVAGSMQRIDMYVGNLGASCTVALYRDNVEVIPPTVVDASVSGLTGLDHVALAFAPAASASYYSEFIVADEDTRSLAGLWQGSPTAAGDANGWDGGAYTDVDELGPATDTDMVYTNQTGRDVQFNLRNTPAGTFTVKAVKIAARASKTAGSTPTSVALGVKVGGVGGTIDPGTAQLQTDSTWKHIERYMANNPVTTNMWTTSELDALQVNLRSS